MTQDIKVEAVTFPSEGTTCAGDLYILHDGVEAPRPGIVLGHGFGSVKEKLVEQGNFFAQAGYAALAIDYRTFGLSEGEPRGQLFPLQEVEDFRNGISYLQTRPEVQPDRIALWGAKLRRCHRPLHRGGRPQGESSSRTGADRGRRTLDARFAHH